MKQTLNKFCFYVSRLNKITWHDQFLQQVTYYILLLLNKNGNKNKSLLRGCATAAHQSGRARAVASKPLHSENDYPPVGKFNTVSSHITNSVSACVVMKIRSAAALMWCEALLHLHSSIRPSVPDSVTCNGYTHTSGLQGGWSLSYAGWAAGRTACHRDNCNSTNTTALFANINTDVRLHIHLLSR